MYNELSIVSIVLNEISWDPEKLYVNVLLKIDGFIIILIGHIKIVDKVSKYCGPSIKAIIGILFCINDNL
jgi:hypothetical protein